MRALPGQVPEETLQPREKPPPVSARAQPHAVPVPPRVKPPSVTAQTPTPASAQVQTRAQASLLSRAWEEQKPTQPISPRMPPRVQEKREPKKDQ
jgi:hypothetical protein